MSDKNKAGAPLCGLYYRLNANDADARQHNDILRDMRQIAMVINRRSGYERNMFVIEIDAAAFSDAHIKTYADRKRHV